MHGDTPTQLGSYRLEKLLGRGGMGEVFLAWDDRLARHVAIKRILSDPPPDERARERFQREARAVARLSHPSIVQIYDLLETDEGDALVMEYVEGRELLEVITRGELELDLALRLAYEIAEGLAEAHGKGLIHRDLKVENVRVTSSRHPKILDFGLARLLWNDGHEGDTRASLTASGALVGTIHAMSPEQASGRPVDHRADLFALGGLLYEMLSGQAPFRGRNMLDTLRRVTSEEPVPLSDLRPGLPFDLLDLVDRLLAKEPNDRPQNARLVANDLERLRASSAEMPVFGALAVPGSGAPAEPVAATPSTTAPATSDLPTGEWPAPPTDQANSAPDTATTKSAPVSRSLAAWKPWAAAVPVVLVLILAAFGVRQLWLLREVPPPRYVAVATPVLKAPEEEREALQLKVGALQAGLLRGLLGYQGVAAVEPTAEDARLTHPVALARALGADEVLASELDCVQGTCQIVLKRLRGEDGSVAWQHRFTEISDNLLDFSLSVASQLHGGFSELALRKGVAGIRVRPEDYQKYLQVKERVRKRHEGELQELLGDLEVIHESSPSFIEAYMLELYLLRGQFFETRRTEDLDRAFEIFERISAWAPEDPRVLRAATVLYLQAGRTEEAAASLDRLEAIEPGDADLLYLRASLMERTGQPQAALPLMREAVQRHPSQEHFLNLADLERRAGHLEEARRALMELLERSPQNFDGLSRLASLELMSGSPDRASELYEKLVALTDTGTELTNLGVSYLLLERYDDAAQTFERALEKSPGSPFALLNLADAEFLRGQEEAANELYERVVEITAADPNPNALLTVSAQALAHLGRFEEAVAAVRKALVQTPEKPWVAYEASLTYALVGENTSAILEARRALAAGIEPRWFEFAWFDPLRDRLQEDLKQGAAGD